MKIIPVRFPRISGHFDVGLLKRLSESGFCTWPRLVLVVLALALLAWVAATRPALADFESALSAYEQGAYAEAYAEFRALAADGDERAAPYVNRARQKLRANQSAARETGTTGSGAETRYGSAAAGQSNGWGPAESWTLPAGGDGGAVGFPDIVIPYNGSLGAELFHLPADATVIGLQYLALLFDAQSIHRDLQIISSNSQGILLSVLAIVWWLIILKALWILLRVARDLLRALAAPLSDDQ